MAQQTIEFNQGDDYLLRLNNFNPEHKYKVYIQFFDEDGAFVGNQLSYDVNYTDSVDVLLPASFTDNLNVPLGEDYQLYYLGGKQAEVVENKVNLYAFDNDGSSLYTHNLNIAVDDVLYDEDNHETEYDVDAINSIVNDSGTFERDSANNLLEYRTDLYAWSYVSSIDNTETIVYTMSNTPETGAPLYDENGDVTEYTISEFHNLYFWGYPSSPFYTYSANPQVNDYVYDKYGVRSLSGHGYVSEVGENYIVVRLDNDQSVSFTVYRDASGDTSCVARTSGERRYFTRSIEDDIKTAIGVIAYCWSLSGSHVYTIAENPAVGDMTYTYDEELIEGDEITAIASFMVSTDEYVRNANNDIEIIISTAYTGEKTIISELANKRPVIVYKKRAEGPV